VRGALDGEANAGLQADGTWDLRAVVCTRYGPPEVLRLEELETPAPQKNELRTSPSRRAASGMELLDGYDLRAPTWVDLEPAAERRADGGLL
jgi:hypothetical protein